tara:strand:- start:75026 stop:76168 length:1143 start_codon:yes stop_codon:yes gene_type:complete
MADETVKITSFASINSHHAIDEIGILTGLERLPEEHARSFRDRTLDVYVNKANATYGGLITGANRELGFLKEKTLEISLLPNIIYSSQAIIITQTGMYLVSDLKPVDEPSTIELSIDIFNDFLSPEFDYHARYISDVADIINNVSSIFEATVVETEYNYKLASTLIQSNSWKYGLVETISANRYKLSHENIIPHTVTISNPDIDVNIVSSITGDDYHTRLSLTSDDLGNDDVALNVDVKDGYTTLAYGNTRLWERHALADNNLTIRYAYNIFPFVAYSAPIEVYELSDYYFQTALYGLELNQTNQYVRTYPNRFGAKLITNTIEDSHTQWGGMGARSTPLAADNRNTDVLDGLNLSDIDGAVLNRSIAVGTNHVSIIGSK